VSDTRDLVSNHLPAAIIVYPHCHVAVLAATFLAAVLCTLKGHRSYVQGHVSMDLCSFTLGANRLKFSCSCFQVRQPLTFCDQFAARIDEYVIISPNLLQRIQIALRKGLTVFPKSLLKILFNAELFSLMAVVCPAALCGVVRQSNETNPMANIHGVCIFIE